MISTLERNMINKAMSQYEIMADLTPCIPEMTIEPLIIPDAEIAYSRCRVFMELYLYTENPGMSDEAVLELQAISKKLKSERGKQLLLLEKAMMKGALQISKEFFAISNEFVLNEIDLHRLQPIQLLERNLSNLIDHLLHDFEMSIGARKMLDIAILEKEAAIDILKERCNFDLSVSYFPTNAITKVSL